MRLEEALEVCFRGLDDPLTHLVYRSALERRIKRLESLLKRPLTERTTFSGLEKAEERVIVGKRLDEEVDRRVMGRHSVWRGEKVTKVEEVEEESEGAGVVVVAAGGEEAVATETGTRTVLAATEDEDTADPPKPQATEPYQTTEEPVAAEPMELDPGSDDELGPEVRVEQVALEAYAKEGWKGYHSEGGIVTTIWGLLMWDVIFAPVDGAFETAYQSEPLDLRTDSFAVGESPCRLERPSRVDSLVLTILNPAQCGAS